jgi:hypothetical protein
MDKFSNVNPIQLTALTKMERSNIRADFSWNAIEVSWTTAAASPEAASETAHKKP